MFTANDTQRLRCHETVAPTPGGTSMAVLLVFLAATSLVLVWAALVLIRARRRPVSLPHAFRCKIVLLGSGHEPTVVRWPRATSYGIWVHDVLVVFTGMTRTQVHPY